MYGREELETYYKTSCVYDTDVFYGKEEADSVMDAMEARIKELEEANKLAVVVGNQQAGRIKELEKQLEDVQNTMATENVDLGMENHKLKERVKELEAVISKMETTQKWISVEDRLPKREELVNKYDAKEHRQWVGLFYEGKDYEYTHWKPLPPPPTSEESLAIEKEK